MLDESEVNGDPVLLDCRRSPIYNNELEPNIPYIGNNNRSPAVFETRINNELSQNQNQNGGAGINRNYASFPVGQWNHVAEPEPELTVSVQNMYKAYDTGKPVLSNLCMNVRKGTIYGLLGSSGCGKTTLLSCIVGLKKWDSGRILLFNREPNGAPGRRVGFMPQDTALYDQISVREMIGYYSRLYGMAEKEVEEQWLWLIDFLQLPAKFRLIKDLSGGQKRRVSLAITLVHSPDLLILDEPTVGLDPLLRESIWEHLFNIVQTRKTTVIITTHYIEEARFSNTIGVMRKGRLLVEDSPETLLQLYQCDLLEQVVLKLCRKDEQVSSRDSDTGSNNNGPSVVVLMGAGKGGKGKLTKSSKNIYNVQERMLEQEQMWSSERRRSSSIISKAESEAGKNGCGGCWSESSIFDRVRALSTVIWLMFLRHPVFITMVLFLPTLQLILTLAVLGTHPKDLKFGVVNEDMLFMDSCFDHDHDRDSNYVSAGNTALATNGSCDYQQLSCSLITELSKKGTFNLIPMQSKEAALEQVHAGDMWGYFSFPSNYSKHLQDFVAEHKFAENETLEGSRVRITMDMSHYMGAAFAIRDSFEAYEAFAQSMAISCGMNPKEFSLPFEYTKPVFGKTDVSYHDYVIPIVILTVVFEIPMLVTSILFINDRKQGTLDRAIVAGLHFKEVMLSHFLTQGSVIIGQTAICSVVMKLFYGFTVEGSYSLYFFVVILGGICGESLGLLLGVIFGEEVEALMFGIFCGPILLMYEGALWPVEGMRPAIRTIAYLSPTTLTIKSVRSIVYRGVGFMHDLVWPGFAMMGVWIIAIWVVSITLFIRKQR